MITPVVTATDSQEAAADQALTEEASLTEVAPTATSTPEMACETVETQRLLAEGLPIDDFFDRSSELILLRRPQRITELGIEERFGLRNDRLDNLSDAYLHGTYDLKQAILERLQQFDRISLTPEQ